MQAHQDDNEALARRVHEGDVEARDQMIVANIRLVFNLTRREVERWPDMKDDIIQEGVTGLIRAVEGYNPEAGMKFSTYASPWIKGSVKRAMASSRGVIKVAPGQQGLVRKLEELVKSNLTVEEAAKTLKLSKSKLKTCLSAMMAGAVWRDGDDSANIIEAIRDHRDPERSRKKLGRIEMVEEAVKKIDEMEATVIRMCFGLAPFGESRNSRKVAEALGIPMSEVARLRRRGLGQIRAILDFRATR